MAKLLTARAFLRALVICCLLGLAGVGLWMIGVQVVAEHHRRQARRCLQRQDYSNALRELEAALRLRPRNADLHLLAGRTARQGGKFSLAWDHLHRCHELQGLSSELQFEEYLLRAQTGELEDVYRFLFPHLTTDDAQTPLVLEALSHVYLFLYRFDSAWRCLSHWLTLQPDNVEALFLRGNYYSLTGKHDLAAADLRRVLERDPKRIHARLLMAQTLRGRLHTKEAAEEFATALQQDPSNDKARLGLAGCYVDQREWSEAEALLQGCSAERAQGADFAHLKGLVAEGQGRYAEAVSYLRAALEATPSDDIACYHLMLCYERLDDEASASKYAEALHKIEKDQMRILAITTKEEKESLTSNPVLCCELGEICLRLGIERRGLHWLQTALKLDPHYRPAHQQLLRYYERLGPEGEKEAQFHRRMLGQSVKSGPRASGNGDYSLAPAP